MNSDMQKISIFWKISCFCLMFVLIATAASPAASSESYVSDQGGDRQTDRQMFWMWKSESILTEILTV